MILKKGGVVSRGSLFENFVSAEAVIKYKVGK